MSTPTTVKFQIAVPSTSGNGGAEKVYTLTLSLQVEGCSEGEIKVMPVLSAESGDPEVVLPSGNVPLIQDPPKPN
ncbi:MAG TPA: hypothetical protein VNM67_25530 [Thermoanaerobaculia bacterium]|nr:hypothetical protein [Thermoanaerobaculia bacterium]